MKKKINIGIIGLGNIGQALVKNLLKNQRPIAESAGVEVRIKKVCDLRKRKTSLAFTRDAYQLINDPDISVVVEAIGGVNPALKFILAALKNKKHVVTPNKEVMAKHMKEILAASRKNGVQVLFEAAVGGGIPIIRPLRESLVGNRLTEVYGIVNGTTNYILSQMTEKGMEFSQALQKAAEKGYAEPNPSSDIDGYDASYKAAILASVAFKADVDWHKVYFEGIRKITQEDIQYARDIGYVIKLLAIAKLDQGALEVRVHPALVPQSHPLASVSDNYNAIYVKGIPVGQQMFYGEGAGGGPTASAIISDIIAIAKSKGKKRPIKFKKIRTKKIEDVMGRFYIRLQAPDKYGVLAGISRAFAQKKVSIAAVVQKETVGNLATIVILVHNVAEKNLKIALKTIKKRSIVRRVSNLIRII